MSFGDRHVRYARHGQSGIHTPCHPEHADEQQEEEEAGNPHLVILSRQAKDLAQVEDARVPRDPLGSYPEQADEQQEEEVSGIPRLVILSW